MFALSLFLVLAPVPKTEPADWKPVIKERAFKFEEAQTAAKNANDEARKAGLTVDVAPDGEFTFAKKDGPKVVVNGHPLSAFAVYGDALYFADFSSIANGCKLITFDLATGKKVRDQALDGIGAVAHTKYRNRVVMSVEKHPTVKDSLALVVTGWEAAGAYIEVLDLATGKQLAHKKFETNELPK
ncbi:MAG: hypothetical protein K8U57_12985 [Planctomycetes bacterium]|nr:hypothetical protein [Planctomycetota bacterium]